MRPKLYITLGKKGTEGRTEAMEIEFTDRAQKRARDVKEDNSNDIKL